MSTKYTKKIKKLAKDRTILANTILNDDELDLYTRFSTISNANLLKPCGWIIHPLLEEIKQRFPQNDEQYYHINEEEYFTSDHRGATVDFANVLDCVYDNAQYGYMELNHPDNKYGCLPYGVDIKDLPIKIGRVKIGPYGKDTSHDVYMTVREFENMLLEIAKKHQIVSFTYDW